MAIDPATATLVGSVLTNAANFAMGERQNRFTRQMSSTAHQRQAEDLRRAGINPLLGAGGVGASSPVGSQVRFEDSISKSVTSGLNAKINKAQLDKLYAETQNVTMDSQLKAWEMEREQKLLPARIGHLQSQASLFDMDRETKGKVLAFVAEHYSSEIARNLASAWQSRSGARLHDAETILKDLAQHRARNASDAEQSWFFRTLGPYTHSGGQAGALINSLAGFSKLGQGVSDMSKKFFERVDARERRIESKKK